MYCCTSALLVRSPPTPNRISFTTSISLLSTSLLHDPPPSSRQLTPPAKDPHQLQPYLLLKKVCRSNALSFCLSQRSSLRFIFSAVSLSSSDMHCAFLPRLTILSYIETSNTPTNTSCIARCGVICVDLIVSFTIPTFLRAASIG